MGLLNHLGIHIEKAPVKETLLASFDLSWLNGVERSVLLEDIETACQGKHAHSLSDQAFASHFASWRGRVSVPSAQMLTFRTAGARPVRTPSENLIAIGKLSAWKQEVVRHGLLELHYQAVGAPGPTPRLIQVQRYREWGFTAATVEGVRNFSWSGVKDVYSGIGVPELQDHRYHLLSVSGRVRLRRKVDGRWQF